MAATLLIAAGAPASEPPAPRRVTPEGQDASHPAWSPDGRSIAFVRSAQAGEEIWTVELGSGVSRRRASFEDLKRGGLAQAPYTLDEITWSPTGDRLAFTWLSGEGWGQIAIAEGDGAITLVPAPVIEDPWVEGSSFSLSASSFAWDASGGGGSFIGWDDDCGSIYLTVVPSPGTLGHSAVALPDGCRTQLRGAHGLWLFTELDENLLPRVGVVDGAGAEIDSLMFPLGPAPRVGWGREAGSRPPIAGWWDDADRSSRMLFVWSPGALVEWGRLSGVGEGGGVVVLEGGSLLFLDGPAGGYRLMRLDGPGTTPREIVAAPVTDFRLSPDGRRVVVVRGGGLWVVEVGARDASSGGAQRDADQRPAEGRSSASVGRAAFTARRCRIGSEY